MCKRIYSAILTSKILLFIFNILFLLISAAYLGIGSYFLNILQNSPDFFPIQFYYRLMGSLMLTVGLIGIFVSFFGFYLSFSRSIILLIVYVSLLIFVMLFGIVTGIVGLIEAYLLPRWITKNLNAKNFFTLISQGNIDLADRIQLSYKCCGLNSPDDWFVLQSQPLPDSCCIGTDEFNCEGGSYYQIGCLDAIRSSIKNNMSIAGGISLGIALPIIFGIVFACGLIMDMRKKPKSYIIKSINSF